MIKICSKCGLEKGLVDFYRDKTKSDGRRSHCKVCINTYNQTTSVCKYRLRAIEKFKRAPQYKTLDREYCKRYRESDHGREVRRQQTRRYREQKQRLDFRFTLEDAATVHTRFNHQCFNCGSVDRLSIDHHRPLSYGFGLSVNNAVLLCSSCNSSKGNQMPEDVYNQKQLETLNGFGIV
jgi:5-methylcytosine-specific restriction endonuclease McrA